MRCEDCHVYGGVDPDRFDAAVREVVEKLDAGEDVDVTVVAVADPSRCGAIADDLSLPDREAFVENCRSADTSLSFRTDGHEYIIVRTDKPFLQEDDEALRGLVAHELMHAVQRRQGVEEDIQEAAQSYEDTLLAELQDRGFTPEEANRFIRTVFSTTIFALKDVYANTELVRQSFVSDLEAYYYQMLDVDEYCPAPEFYGEEAELREVEDAVTFELGILPAWLPFVVLNRPEADEIRQRLDECYSQEIPLVSYHVGKIQELYMEEYDDPATFKNKFFREMMENVYEVIEKKLPAARPGGGDEEDN